MQRAGSAMALLAAALAVVPLATGGFAAAAGEAGLPSVASGHRPGPDALYLAAPDAPQLENTGPWRAEPILVSGASAYRDGEWLYQDFLFDDHGATGVPSALEDPYGVSTNLYSPTAGTFLYPTHPDYAHNAADLVELRIKPLGSATAFRVTLNTLIDPSLTAFTIALGDTVENAAWPHGAGVASAAELFLTWHGDTVELTAADGAAVMPAPTVVVDLERRQVDLRVPHAAWDPGSSTVRTTIGVGLWDTAAGTYLAPQAGDPDESTPGGGLPLGAALVNVGPRYDEPVTFIAGLTMADMAAGARVFSHFWRERQQSLQLTMGDVSPFFADVEFAKLHAGVDDDNRVPTSGPMNRLMPSRHVFGQGIEPDNVCFGISSGIDLGVECVGRYVGQLQPYAIHVPDTPVPEGGYGLTLLLHSLSANHNQYLGTSNMTQLAERGPGSIVITPEARGPDGFYAGIPEAHTFEVWADVARHYPLAPDWAAASGYSMGGFGTYRLMARYPDLFSRGFSVVGVPGSVSDQLVSLRNTPIMAWNALADELVNVTEAEQAHADLAAAGVDHQYWQFTADHLTLAGNDEYGPGAEFLGDHRVDRDPAMIAYVVDPREDSRDVVADHAYWLSDLTVRDTGASPTGQIEVHSDGFGLGVATGEDRGVGAGVLSGGQNQAMPYVSRGLERVGPGPAPRADRLTITAANISHVTIDTVRARVSCDPELNITTDGPIDVELTGCDPAGPPTPEAGTDEPMPATGGGLALASLALALAMGHRRLRRG